MSSGDAVKRTIDSPLRREQAAETRRRIVAAGARLFTSQGYMATSIEDIALEAGVGRATVFKAVGGKGVVLKLAFDTAVAGDDAPVPVAARPDVRRIEDEPDPHRALELFARGLAQRESRAGPIYWAVVEAAGADPQARELLDELDAQRDRAGRLVAAAVARKGPFRDGIDEEAAAQILSVFVEPVAYRTLVVHHGWTVGRFADWLATTLVDQLLPPRRPPQFS